MFEPTHVPNLLKILCLSALLCYPSDHYNAGTTLLLLNSLALTFAQVVPKTDESEQNQLHKWCPKQTSIETVTNRR